jgi:Lrp/AsnC family transcriptional regulator, leucine-responsive regulatory protein
MKSSAPELDEIDRRILFELQKNGRLTIGELAEKVNTSSSPCWRRVKQLEETGIIARYVALVDPNAIGLPVTVFTNVSLEKKSHNSLEDFESQVVTWPEVMECYLMTGDADYGLRVVVPDLSAYERFLMQRLVRVSGVSNVKSFFVLRRVKYHTELPLTHIG